MKYWIIFILGLCMVNTAIAGEFIAVPEASELRFQAVQNDAPVIGKFTRFEADISFDPKKPEEGKIKVTVDLSSVSADYAEVATTLKAADWFDVAQFPHAVFESSSIKEVTSYRAREDANKISYQADGTLTLRGVSKPLTIIFSLDRYDEQGAEASGYAVALKRNEFGVGQGEWASTSSVQDLVDVTFKLSAKRK